MIDIVKNELYKIFHKKGIYIVLVITVLFSILTNFIYSKNFLIDFLEDDTFMNETILKDLEDEKQTQTDEYVSTKVSLETVKYAQNFKRDSWQYYVLKNGSIYDENIYDFLETIISHEVGLTKDEEAYEKALAEKENLLNRLENMTWQDYAQEEKNYYEKQTKKDNEIVAQLEALELRIKYDIPYADNSFNDDLRDYRDARVVELSYEGMDEKLLKDDQRNELKEAVKMVETTKYRLSNSIEEAPIGSNNTVFNNFYNEYFIMIIVMIVLISGSIVSDEFSKGTIKMLLVKPHSRTKILMGKFIATLLMVLFAIASCLMIQFVVGGFFFGFNSLAIPNVIYNYNTGLVKEMSVYAYFSYNTIAVLPQFILIATIGFALSTMTMSTSLSNTLTIIGIFGSDFINSLATSFDLNILKFFLTLNWDFTPYLFGGSSLYKGITLPFSIFVCLFYFVMILFLTIVVFQNRDVKNI